MPRDYKKTKKTAKKKRGASRTSGGNSVPMGLWLFTLFLVFALAGGLVYLKWFNPNQQAVVENNQSTKSQPKESTGESNEPADEDVPFYDVHEDLTTKEVEIPQEDLKLPDNYKQYYYTMPCGSFREPERAEELKARIAMAGSNSNTTNVQSKGQTWYRVQLGPYNSKRNAEKVRHRLQDNGIHDCVIIPHRK